MKLFDAGLQPERSELAWRRTSLTVGLGAVVSVRLLPALLGDASWALVGVGGMGLSTILWVASRVRYRRINAVLHRDGSYAALPGAALLGALAVFASFVGLAALALVVALSVGVGRGS